jgi:hypothetical protein
MHRAWITAVVISVLAHVGLLGVLGSKPLSVKSSNLVTPASLTLWLHQTQISSAASNSAADEKPPTVTNGEAAIAIVVNSTDTQRSQASPPSPDTTANIGLYYYPTEALTAKPIFLHAIGAPDPMFIPDVMPLPVVAHVYISENGHVDAVVLDDNFLSDTALQFIEASFTAMEFRPGLLGTLPVKSELTIEIKLDPALPLQ